MHPRSTPFSPPTRRRLALALIALAVLAAAPAGAVGPFPEPDPRVDDLWLEGNAVTGLPVTVVVRLANDGFAATGPVRLCLTWNVAAPDDSCAVTHMSASQPLNERALAVQSGHDSSVLLADGLPARSTREVRVEWEPNEHRPRADPQVGHGVVVARVATLGPVTGDTHPDEPRAFPVFVHAPRVELRAHYHEHAPVHDIKERCPTPPSVSRGNCLVRPGASALFELAVRNSGNAPDAVHANWTGTAGVDMGFERWKPHVAPERVSLDTGETAIVTLVVTAPEDARAGETLPPSGSWESSPLHVIAASETNPRARDHEPFPRVVVQQVYAVDAETWQHLVHAQPGVTTNGNFSIRNTGNGADTFVVDVVEFETDFDPAEWALEVPEPVKLSPGKNATLAWFATPPADVAPGDYALTLRVASDRDPYGEAVDELRFVVRVH